MNFLAKTYLGQERYSCIKCKLTQCDGLRVLTNENRILRSRPLILYTSKMYVCLNLTFNFIS